MPIHIVRNDITRMKVDAIVNAANQSLLGGGGVDGAIHRAAGKALYEECRALGGCLPGEAKITKGYNLPAKYIIHTVGPVWRGGKDGEEETLRACYRNCLRIAKEYGMTSVAFPMISTGLYGYPRDEAFRVQKSEIRKFLADCDMDVSIVVFDRESLAFVKEIEGWILSCVSDGYVDNALAGEKRRRKPPTAKMSFARSSKARSYTCSESEEAEKEAVLEACASSEGAPNDFDGDALFRMLSDLDDSFSKTLLRLIDEKGITDVTCYKRANLDRKHFSKIRSDADYKPSKKTALALAVALELSYDETQVFLATAGFTLSKSAMTDVIVSYFLHKGIYDIDIINATLFEYDQALLGA